MLQDYTQWSTHIQNKTIKAKFNNKFLKGIIVKNYVTCNVGVSSKILSVIIP